MDTHSIDEEAVFYAAVEKPASERVAYLREVCGDDLEMLRRLEALLSIRNDRNSILEVPPYLSHQPIDELEVEKVGAVIGRYKLLEKIGEGGMASVFMAEQKEPIRRKAALKIIKLGMDTKQVIARFEAERQALAMMDHPNIAKVFDAGATENGRPYFVMELVRGISITEYCDENNLSTQERLGLFIPVCQAIQHAHQKGIIHRDIKPTNVLVTLHDGVPVPKVIDFGIAKATDQSLTDKTVFTRFMQMIGTPEYMSPEQAEMSGLDIDTRSDIYSLGVLLYELLTGSTPIDRGGLLKKGYREIQRIILEDEPSKPSTKLSTLGESLTDVARRRRTAPEVLRKSVQGDLDWIVMKSLEKDRRRRYDTAHALLDDIQRHLNSEPIRAGSPGVWYRLKKYVRRHKTAAVVVMLALTVAVSLTFSGYAYVQSVHEKARNESFQHRQVLADAEEQYHRKQYAEALALIKPYRGSSHIQHEAELLHAQALLKLNRRTEAIEAFAKLTEEPGAIAGKAHFHLATIYYQFDPQAPGETFREQWEFHRSEAERLLAGTPDYYYLQALDTDIVSHSLDYLKQALALERDHVDALRERAYIHLLNREYKKALRDAVRITGIEPEQSIGYSLSAIASREMGDYDEAIEDHTTAIRLSPNDPMLYEQRRKTFVFKGDYDSALADAKTAYRLDSDNLLYHFNIFSAYTALGQYKEAAETFTYQTRVLGNKEYFFDVHAYNHTFMTLSEGRIWHPEDKPPTGRPFLMMQEAARHYHALSKQGRIIAYDASYLTFSHDMKKTIYSRGWQGYSGIEVKDTETGKTELILHPGMSAQYSPDGNYIAYTQNRYALPKSTLIANQRPRFDLQENEIYVMKADLSEPARKMTEHGGFWWSDDSKSINTYSRKKGIKYSFPIMGENRTVTQSERVRTPFPAQYSPNEKYVAYAVDSFVQVVEVESKEIIFSWLGPNVHWGYRISWSPDSQKIYLSGGSHYVPGGQWEISLPEKRIRNINSLATGRIQFAPDGQIYFSMGGGAQQIWALDSKTMIYRSPQEYLDDLASLYSKVITATEDTQITFGFYLMRSYIHFYRNDYKNAFKDINQAMLREVIPNHFAYCFKTIIWSFVYVDKSYYDAEQLLKVARLAYEKLPDNGALQQALGAALYRAGYYEEAREILERKIEVHSGNGRDYFILALVCEQTGHTKKGREWYDKGKAHPPEKYILESYKTKLLETEAEEFFNNNNE